MVQIQNFASYFITDTEIYIFKNCKSKFKVTSLVNKMKKKKKTEFKSLYFLMKCEKKNMKYITFGKKCKL